MYSFIVCLYSNIRYALLPTIRKFSKTCIKKCLSKVNNVSSIKLDAIIFSLFLSLGNNKVLAIPNFPNLFICRCKIAIKTQWKVLQLKCLLCKGCICISLLFDRDIQNEISCVHKKYSAISSTFFSCFPFVQ